jgi:hypothetical protein
MPYRGRLIGAAISLAAVLGSALAVPALANQPLIQPFPNVPGEFPAGVACPFAVAHTPVSGNETDKQYFDRAGNFVKEIITGGFHERLTNVDTGKSLIQNASGVARITPNPNGTYTLIETGENGILDPSVNSGDLTHLSGRAIFNVSADFSTLTLISIQGATTDLCTALS